MNEGEAKFENWNKYIFNKKEPNLSELEKETLFIENGIIIASNTDKKPCIGTRSLESCAGIAIYDEKNKIGG